MATNFPTGLDAFDNPAATDQLDHSTYGLKHSVQHGNANDAIEALEARVGITNSGVSSSLDYRLASLESLLNLIPGEWPTMPRDWVVSTGIATGTGTLRLNYFTALSSGTTNSTRLVSGGTAGASLTMVRVGLYLADNTGACNLVASTPNDTSLLLATNTAYVKNWSVPYAITRGQRYALALLVIGTTTPTMNGKSAPQTEMGRQPVTTGFLSSQTDLPSAISAGSLGNSANHQYIVAT